MSSEDLSYLETFKNGTFYGVLRWHHLDEFWEVLKAKADEPWFIYAVGEEPPVETVSGEAVITFIAEVDKLLRQEHDEDYCGIVYADDKQNPAFIKIFDPNNLGVACGSSDFPPLPGWIVSKMAPINLPDAMPQPGNRRRWWKRLFS